MPAGHTTTHNTLFLPSTVAETIACTHWTYP